MTRAATSPGPPKADNHRILVLAGGQSRRMGADKAAKRIGSKTLVERACACAREAGYPVVVAGRDRNTGSLPDAVETCADGPGKGPLAGLLGAASIWPGASWLVMACDLPLLTPALLLRLVELAREHPRATAVVPLDGDRMHPLSAWYSPAMVDHFRQSVDAGCFGLTEILAARPDPLVDPSAAKPVLLADAKLLGWTVARLREELLNCNRPEDLLRAQRVLDRRGEAG